MDRGSGSNEAPELQAEPRAGSQQTPVQVTCRDAHTLQGREASPGGRRLPSRGPPLGSELAGEVEGRGVQLRLQERLEDLPTFFT